MDENTVDFHEKVLFGYGQVGKLELLSTILGLTYFDLLFIPSEINRSKIRESRNIKCNVQLKKFEVKAFLY